MTKIQAVRKFGDYIAQEAIVIARNRFADGNWGMDIDNSVPRLVLPKDFNFHEYKDDEFYNDFVSRSPYAKDFDEVTLTILHEFGHWFNRNVMDTIQYDDAFNDKSQNHFTNPYEVLATQWAVCWLMCPINRKMAKVFENDYFGRA